MERRLDMMHVSKEEFVGQGIVNLFKDKPKETETDYFIVSTPEYVVWTCPLCGTENADSFDSFDSEEIYEGYESSFCCYCNQEIKLNGTCDFD